MLWDVASGAELHRFEGHEGGVTCLAKVGANILSAAEDKTLRLWDTATGTLVRVLANGEDLKRPRMDARSRPG